MRDLDPTIHTAAHALLQEARKVAVMHKAHREQYFAGVKVARGSQALAHLVMVSNTVRRTTKADNK